MRYQKTNTKFIKSFDLTKLFFDLFIVCKPHCIKVKMFSFVDLNNCIIGDLAQLFWQPLSYRFDSIGFVM